MPLRLESQSADFPKRFRSLLATKREAAEDVEKVVRGIVSDVAARGDKALIEWTAKFDRIDLAKAGLRVAAAEIDAAQKNFGISSTKTVNADGSYSIGHTSSIYMIDRAGGLRAVMPYGHTVDEFVHDLKILLRQ